MAPPNQPPRKNQRSRKQNITQTKQKKGQIEEEQRSSTTASVEEAKTETTSSGKGVQPQKK